MTEYLNDEERQAILALISQRITMLSGRLASLEYQKLIQLRRKLEGTDKRVQITQS